MQYFDQAKGAQAAWGGQEGIPSRKHNHGNLITCFEWQDITPYNKTISSDFQIITIEAEALADQGENAEHGNKKKDPLLFLHEKEQEKVWKLVSQCQKIGEAEVGVQTDYAIPCK